MAPFSRGGRGVGTTLPWSGLRGKSLANKALVLGKADLYKQEWGFQTLFCCRLARRLELAGKSELS
jgi:hypothetical protein